MPRILVGIGPTLPRLVRRILSVGVAKARPLRYHVPLGDVGILACQFFAPYVDLLMNRRDLTLSDCCSDCQCVPGLAKRCNLRVLIEVALDMDEVTVTP